MREWKHLKILTLFDSMKFSNYSIKKFWFALILVLLIAFK